MMDTFQFQPFEMVFEAKKQNGPAQAKGEFRLENQKSEAILREIDGFLFFNPRNGAPESNFLVASMHSAISNPPRRAFEKLGRAQTLILLQRRALNLGFWGRFFVLEDATDAKFLLFLGQSGRHLLTSWREHRRNPRAEWTPFAWDLTPDLVGLPSPELFEIVKREWNNPNSALCRVRNWSQADYFERLWQSLSFEHGDAVLLREILRDAVGIGAPDGQTSQWILRFQLPENRREGRLTLYEQLFAANEAYQWPLPEEFQQKLLELLEWVNPRRRRAGEIEFVAQREWLEGNSGVGNWSLSVEATPLSSHEKMEAALRLRANLEHFWSRERAEKWMAPFLMAI